MTKMFRCLAATVGSMMFCTGLGKDELGIQTDGYRFKHPVASYSRSTFSNRSSAIELTEDSVLNAISIMAAEHRDHYPLEIWIPNPRGPQQQAGPPMRIFIGFGASDRSRDGFARMIQNSANHPAKDHRRVRLVLSY